MSDDQKCRNYTGYSFHRYQKHKRKESKSNWISIWTDGVDHMLALRGDIPLGETTTCGDFDYATDLVKFVRDTYGDKF